MLSQYIFFIIRSVSERCVNSRVNFTVAIHYNNVLFELHPYYIVFVYILETGISRLRTLRVFLYLHTQKQKVTKSTHHISPCDRILYMKILPSGPNPLDQWKVVAWHSPPSPFRTRNLLLTRFLRIKRMSRCCYFFCARLLFVYRI